MIKNFFLHLNIVNRHRFKVFKLCVKAGIPFRGLVHDLSKYSPTEFFEGVKYYNGKRSPISLCKKERGYSKAWLHHKGRNKHHSEYWYDNDTRIENAIMPYEYAVEMVCDTLAAGMTYKKEEWSPEYQLNYYLNKRQNKLINPKIDTFLIEVYEKIIETSVDEVIKPKVLKQIYYKNVGD